MRTFSAALVLLLLAACQVRKEPAAEAEAGPGDTMIECALDGAAEFKRACAVEKADVDGGRALTVRHPDGGFRRFDVLTDGHGLAVADGADTARTTVEGDTLLVAVDNDRYRFPVTLKSDDPAK